MYPLDSVGFWLTVVLGAPAFLVCVWLIQDDDSEGER